MHQRLMRLEERIGFLDQDVSELMENFEQINKAILSMQKRMDALTRHVQRLEEESAEDDE